MTNVTPELLSRLRELAEFSVNGIILVHRDDVLALLAHIDSLAEQLATEQKRLDWAFKHGVYTSRPDMDGMYFFVSGLIRKHTDNPRATIDALMKG